MWCDGGTIAHLAERTKGGSVGLCLRLHSIELGCLPVSAMIHVPKAAEVFDTEDGYAEGVEAERWAGDMARAFDQLAWWSAAARSQRGAAEVPEAFRRDPSHRNAP